MFLRRRGKTPLVGAGAGACVLAGLLLTPPVMAQELSPPAGESAPAAAGGKALVPEPSSKTTSPVKPEPAPAKPAAPARTAPRPQEPPPPEPGQLFFELAYTVDGTDIQGNAERSFLWSGVNHLAEFSYFQQTTAFGGRKLELLAVGRYTDNPRSDPERNSLQRGYAKLTGRTFEASVGDGLVNYSRLTLNQNIKGLHLWKDFHPRLRAYGTAGFFTDRWGSLYRDYLAFRDVRLDCSGSLPGLPAAGCIENPVGSGRFTVSPESPGKPYSRLSGGARLEWKVGRDGWLAANWSHGKDLLQSLPNARIVCEDPLSGFRTVRFISPGCALGEVQLPNGNRPAREAINNDVLGLDANYEITPWALRLRGEVVTSWTSGGQPPPGAAPDTFICAAQPPIVGGSVLDQRCFEGQVADWAVRFEASQKIRKLSWRADYLRFQPDFYSANARQIRDLQDFVARGDYQFTRVFSTTVSWRRSSDNMNGRRHFTNVVQSPEIRIGFRDIPRARNLRLQGGYRERTVKTTGHPTAAEERDRTTRIPFVGLDYLLGPAQITFDYERRHDTDAVRPQFASDTDSFALALRSSHEWGGWSWRPFFRLELERLRKKLPNNPAQSLSDPLLFFPFDFFDAFDTGRAIQAGFQLEAPSHVRFEGQYREFNSIVLTPLQASAALDPARSFFHLNQGFKRPSWRAVFTYKLRNDENRLFHLFYQRFNNFFDPGDPFVADLKSFRETVIGGSVILRFGR